MIYLSINTNKGFILLVYYNTECCVYILDCIKQIMYAWQVYATNKKMSKIYVADCRINTSLTLSPFAWLQKT